MATIHIPATFSELETLDDGNLQKLVRMATAVLHERRPVTPTELASQVRSTGQHVRQDTVLGARPGRTSKIAQAFENVPATPVDAEDYAAQYDIKVTTLRQQSRFDDPMNADRGKVHVKKSRKDGRLYVWRGENQAFEGF